MNLQLIVSNEWTVIPSDQKQKDGTPVQVFHKDYGDKKHHGLVTIDENGIGNAIIVDRDDNCLGLHESPINCFDYLKVACDKIFNEVKNPMIGAM